MQKGLFPRESCNMTYFNEKSCKLLYLISKTKLIFIYTSNLTYKLNFLQNYQFSAPPEHLYLSELSWFVCDLFIIISLVTLTKKHKQLLPGPLKVKRFLPVLKALLGFNMNVMTILRDHKPFQIQRVWAYNEQKQPQLSRSHRLINSKV